MTPKREMRPLEWHKPDPRELARHNDPEKIRLFGLDLLANGLLHAVSAREDGLLISGHGRWLAARSAGIKEILTNIFPLSLCETKFRLIRIGENLHRSEWSGFEKFRAASELLDLNPGWQLKDLAEQLHLSPASITHLLSPSKCTPAWQEALKAGKATIAQCYATSKLPLEEQDALLLSGASTGQIEKAARKKREPDAVKLSRVTVPLTAGTRIVVSGADMDLEGLIEALTSALSAAKTAQKDRLDVKTFEKVARDKAKAN